ncbi:MAG: hypothetical protein R6X14_02630 [bacterium]
MTNLELARFPVLDWAYQGCINEADGRVYFSSPPLDSVVIIRDSLLTGVNEPRGAQRRSVGRGPTVVRGSLSLTDLGHDPGSENRSGSCPAFLLDATGRKVMELQPGDNDVRHLAPGVYFVRTALWERSPDRDFVRMVAIQR